MPKNIIYILFFSLAVGLTFSNAIHANAQFGGNSPPLWMYESNKAVFVGELLQFRVAAVDINGDGIAYSISSLPSGATFSPQTLTFSWRPNSGQTGNYQVTFRAFDGINSADLNVRILVSDPNNPSNPSFPLQQFPGAPFNPTTILSPVGAPTFLNFNPPANAREGQIYTYTVQASSVVNFPVTYRLISAPEGMTINPSLGIILWLPNFSQGRPEPYIVVIGAATGQYEASRTYNIYVEDVSQIVSTSTPPVVVIPPPVIISPPVVVSPPVTVLPQAPPLVISNIKISQENGEAIISWNTNKKARSRVIYDTGSQAEKQKDFTYAQATPDPDPGISANFVTEHSIRLTSLKGGTKYYFRAVSKTNGEIAVSDEMTFETSRRPFALLSELAEILTNPWFYILFGLVGLFWFFSYRNRKRKEKLAITPKVVI